MARLEFHELKLESFVNGFEDYELKVKSMVMFFELYDIKVEFTRDELGLYVVIFILSLVLWIFFSSVSFTNRLENDCDI